MYTIGNQSSGIHRSPENFEQNSLNRRAKNDNQIYEHSRYKPLEPTQKYRLSESNVMNKKHDFDGCDQCETGYSRRMGTNSQENSQQLAYPSLQHLNEFLPNNFPRMNENSNRNAYSSGNNSIGYTGQSYLYGAPRTRVNDSHRNINPTSKLIQIYSSRIHDYSPQEFANQSNNISYRHPTAIRKPVNGGHSSGNENPTFKSSSNMQPYYTPPYVGSYINNALEMKPVRRNHQIKNKSESHNGSLLHSWSRENTETTSPRSYNTVNESPRDMYRSKNCTQTADFNAERDEERKMYLPNSPIHNGPNVGYDNLPLSPSSVLMRYGQELTKYERKEIMNYSKIYFLGLSAKKRHPNDKDDSEIIQDAFEPKSEVLRTLCNINGFDDAQSSYLVVLNDHIAYRYEIIGHLGKGSFGQVVQAKDHCTKRDVAIKIIRSEDKFTRQAREELDILKVLNEQDKENKHNIIQLLDSFVFRKHVCMVFELLNLNLYELLHRNEFKGLSQTTVCRITKGILDCLTLMYDNQIIHCDLKPENILLREGGLSAVKVIDFGSSCFADKRIYTYIQSRYYRAPEIILGMQYSTAIDMWSLGCIVAELITGLPLFPGEDEEDQLACIMEVIGTPPDAIKFTCRKSNKYFTADGEPRYLSEQAASRSDEEVPGNGETNGGGSSSISNSSIGPGRNKTKQRSRHWKPRKPPSSVDITTALTTPKRSSVYVLTSEYTRGSLWSKVPGSRSEPIDPDMVDFISNCLRWWPKERMLPKEALQHPWIVKHKVGLKQTASKTPSLCERNSRYADLLKKTYESPTFYRVPESYEATEEVRQGMQAVKLRRPVFRNNADNRRCSQITGRCGRDLSRGYKRYSTGHETIRHLMGSTSLSSSSSSDLSKAGLDTEPTNQHGASEIREFREFLNGDLTDGLMASVDQSAVNGRLSEIFNRQRPRRASGHRISSVLYTNTNCPSTTTIASTQ